MSDAEGFARDDDWAPGQHRAAARAAGAGARGRSRDRAHRRSRHRRRSASIDPEIVRLFAARDADYRHVTARGRCAAPGGQRRRHPLRRQPQHQLHQHLLLPLPLLRLLQGPHARGPARRALRSRAGRGRRAARSRPGSAAPPRSACRAASIRDYTGETYVAICRAIKAAVPDMHIHAFSPLEVTQGAATPAGAASAPSSAQLKEAGLGTLPGTAAEILDDEVRAIICPDKINTAAMARRAARRAWARPAHDLDHHVRPCRDLARLGAPSAGAARPAGRDRRLHRVRAAAVRAHGSADVSARAAPAAGRPSARR